VWDSNQYKVFSLYDYDWLYTTYLHSFIDVIDDNVDVEVTATHFLQKMKLIAIIHENVLLNVKQMQKKQKNNYATRKGKQTFEGLIVGKTMVKMKKLGNKKALSSSWEGPYQFVGYGDGNGYFDFEKGSRICIIKDVDEHHWERSCRDLQVYLAL